MSATQRHENESDRADRNSCPAIGRAQKRRDPDPASDLHDSRSRKVVRAR